MHAGNRGSIPRWSTMIEERYDNLQWGQATQLTHKELEDGWHWCSEMDDLLCLLGSDDCFCRYEK